MRSNKSLRIDILEYYTLTVYMPTEGYFSLGLFVF